MSPRLVGYDARERETEDLASQIKSFKAKVATLVNRSPHEPRKEISFRQALINLSDRAMEYNVSPELHEIRQIRSMRGHEKFFSKEPLGKLTPIYIKDMLIEKRYLGRVLVCQVVSMIVSFDTIFFAVKDPNGNYAIVELHSYPVIPLSVRFSTMKDKAAVFTVGTLLAIKEPRLSETYPGEEMALPVWTMTDVEFLKPDDALVSGIQWPVPESEETHDRVWSGVKEDEKEKSLTDRKALGNQAYSKAKYPKALKLYTAGIQAHPNDPDLHLLFLNRSAANLVLERVPDALRDVEEALRLIAEKLQISQLMSEEYQSGIKWDEKARIRRAKCFYRLRQWDKALESYEDVLARFPNSTEGQQGVSLCESRLREQSSGEYDLGALFKQIREKGQNRVDVADYIGPVEVAGCGRMGRGLVVTRDVKIVALDFATLVQDSPSKSQLPYELMYKLKYQPELKAVLSRLDQGPGRQTPPIFPIKDMYKAKVNKNQPIDPNALDRLVSFASWSFDSINYNGGDEDPRNPPHIGNPCGLFPYSALINPSCIGNATCSYLGDLQLIRASEDLTAGTQILVSHLPEEKVVTRARAIKERFGPDFVCHCDLCEDDRKDPKDGAVQRLRLWYRFQGQYVGKWPGNPRTEAQARRQIIADSTALAALEATYSDDRTTGLRYHTVFYHLTMGHMWINFTDLSGFRKDHEAIKAYKNVLRGLGAILREDAEISNDTVDHPIKDVPNDSPILSLPQMSHDLAIMVMGRMATNVSRNVHPKEGQRWVDAMKWADSLVMGPSLVLFKARNVAIIQAQSLQPYV